MTDPSQPLDPLQRRPDESFRAYRQFALYAGLPANMRTLAGAARLLGVSRQAVHQTAVRHGWRDRAGTLDRTVVDPFRDQSSPAWLQELDLESLRQSPFAAWFRGRSQADGESDATPAAAP